MSDSGDEDGGGLSGLEKCLGLHSCFSFRSCGLNVRNRVGGYSMMMVTVCPVLTSRLVFIVRLLECCFRVRDCQILEMRTVVDCPALRSVLVFILVSPSGLVG